MKMRKNKIRYVYLDSSRFFTDIQFVKMKPDERGVYCTLIFALYVNGGYIEFNDDLPVLCNCTKKKFEKIWNNIKSKFGQKRTKIFHKKVLKELKISRVRSQMLSDKGLKGANARWNKNAWAMPGHSLGNANENEKERDENVNENRTEKNENEKKTDRRDTSDERRVTNFDSSSNKISSTDSISFRQSKPDENDPSVKMLRVHSRAVKFADFLNKNLKALTRSDRTAFNNIIDHLTQNCRSGCFSIDIFDKATELIKEAKKGDNPNALFMSLARKFLNYSRKTPPQGPAWDGQARVPATENKKSKTETFKSNFAKG